MHKKGVFGSLPEDYTGQKFGKLTVLRLYKRSKDGNIIWECRCDCGKITHPWQTSLRRKKAKSCMSCSHIKPESAFTLVWHSYRNAAKRKNHTFTLSTAEFKTLVEGDCYYCGAKPANISSTDLGAKYTYNGIDRTNNSLGYDLPNCVSCCRDCNYFKRERDQDTFLNKIAIIYKRRIQNA